MSPQTKKAQETTFDDVAKRVRDLNNQIIETSRKTGLAYLDAYEQTLGAIADSQEKLASQTKGSRIEWLTSLLEAQATFTRETARLIAKYYREMLP